MRDYPFQTGLTIALLGAALAAARMLTPAPLLSLVEFTPERTPLTPAAPRVAAAPAPARAPASIKATAEPLFDDSAGALDHFYGALSRTEAREAGAVTRIVHYGDSPTTADLITGDVRSMLQARYGDAGHGFILAAKPWAWYQHSGAEVEGKGWQINPASHFVARDGLFGLGGVSFAGAGASRMRFTGGYTRVELWYLRQPGGGTVGVSADGVEVGSVDTAGEKQAGFAAFETREPAHLLELSVTLGSARIFGVTAERAGPGVVYDSLGLNGASVTVLSRMFNQQHWAAELEHRNPDLVIVNYGTNEADFAEFVEKGYEKELREAIRRLRAALPEASILVMSPMDRGRRSGSGEIETMATIPEIVAIQRRVARETGCGFFDTFRAMGGDGTMARWYAAQPRLVSADFIHPYPAGGKQIAVVFTRELAGGLNRYKLRLTTSSAVR